MFFRRFWSGKFVLIFLIEGAFFLTAGLLPYLMHLCAKHLYYQYYIDRRVLYFCFNAISVYNHAVQRKVKYYIGGGLFFRSGGAFRPFIIFSGGFL